MTKNIRNLQLIYLLLRHLGLATPLRLRLTTLALHIPPIRLAVIAHLPLRLSTLDHLPGRLVRPLLLSIAVAFVVLFLLLLLSIFPDI